MATNTWSSAGDTDGNTVGNWSLGALASTDTLTFDATSTVNCTFSGNITCTVFTMAAGYTGTINFSSRTYSVAGSITLGSAATITEGTASWTMTATGSLTSNGKKIYDFTVNISSGTCTIADAMDCHAVTTTAGAWTNSGTTITASGNLTFNSTSTHNLGTGLTMNGNSATLTYAATAGAPTIDNCTLTMNGTTGMSTAFGKAITFWAGLVLGASAIVTNSGSSQLYTRLLTMGNNSTLTLTGNVISMYPLVANPITLGTGYTINGTQNFNIFAYADITLPAITLSGTNQGMLLIGAKANCIIILSGALNITGQLNLYSYNYAGATTTTYNTAGYAVTCTAFRYNSVAQPGYTCIVTFGNTTLTCTSFGNSADDLAGSIYTLNLNTVTINCSGNLLMLPLATGTVNPSTSTLNITNTSTVTLSGKSLYNLTINASGKTVTQSGALTTAAGGAFTMTAGTYTTATNALTIGGALAVNGTSTLTLTSSTVSFGGNITTAAGCTFTTTSATFTVTAASTVDGNGKSFPYTTFQQGASFSSSITFARVKYTAGKTYTFTVGINFTLTAYTDGDMEGTGGNPVTLTSTGAWTFTNPASMNLSNVAVAYSAASSDIIASDGTCTDNGGNNAHWIFIEGTTLVRCVFKTANTAYLELNTVGASTSSFTIEECNFNEGISLIAVTGGSIPAGYSTQEADVTRNILFGNNVNIPKIAAAAGKQNYVLVDENGKLTKGAEL